MLKAIWEKKSPEIPLRLFGIGCLLLDMGTPLSVANIPSETALWKTNSSFVSSCQLEITSWLETATHIHFAHSELWDPNLACNCRLCMLTQSLWVQFVYGRPILLPWCHLSLRALKIFWPPLWHSSLIPVGMSLMKASHLVLSFQKHLTFWMLSKVGLGVNSHLLQEESLRGFFWSTKLQIV